MSRQSLASTSSRIAGLFFSNAAYQRVTICFGLFMICLKLSSWVFVFCAVVHEHMTMPRRNAKAHFTLRVLMFRRRSEQLLLPYEGCANHPAMLDEHPCRSRRRVRSRPVPLNLCAEHHPGN